MRRSEDWRIASYHFLFWVTLMIGFTAMAWPRFHSLFDAFIYQAHFLPVWFLLTYLNWGLLMDRFFYRKSKFLYIFLLSLLLGLATVAQRFFMLYWVFPTYFQQELTAERMPFLIFKLVEYAAILLFPVLFSIGIKIARNWYDEKNKAQQLVLETKESELNYLKAQVNPHFLFNILNNLYGLSLERSEKVPSLILQLSKILNYSVYESEAEEIEIGQEIELIQHLTALEKERYNGRLKVDLAVSDQLNLKTPVAPLLFMPLVENAFKHGINGSTQQVSIGIKVQQNNDQLIFEVTNPFSQLNNNGPSNGFGLKNLLRRLELLYPKAYSFDTQQLNTDYKATLKLNLNGKSKVSDR